MEYLIIIAASFGVYAFQKDLKPCSCTPYQNVLVTDSNRIYIKEETLNKCLADLDLYVKITPERSDDFLDKEYRVKLVSSIRGTMVSKTMRGSPEIILREKIKAKKNEIIWIDVESSGKYLFSVTAK